MERYINSQNMTGHLDVDCLKDMYHMIQRSPPTDCQNERVRSVLESNALVRYDDNMDLNELMRRKYFALRCLMILPQHLNEEFCLSYYSSISDILRFINPTLGNQRGLRILEGYMNISTNLEDKLILLQTLTACLAECEVDLTVFEEFPSSEWRKQMLVFVLFTSINTDMNAIDNVLNKINNLDKTENDLNRNITENLLEALIIGGNDYASNILFISDLIDVITFNQYLLESVSFNFDKLHEVVYKIKLEMITDCCKKFSDFSSKKHLPDLKYFLKYPFEVIKLLVTTKKNLSLKSLLNLKQVLEFSNMNLMSQINILLRIDTMEPLEKVKNEITFEITKNIITNIFPSYPKYYDHVSNSNKLVNSVHLVTSSNIKCACYNMDSKCALHHSTECCDLLYVLNMTIARVIFNCTDPSEHILNLISTLVAGINHAKRIIELINALDTIDEYNFKFSDKGLFNFLSDLTADDYETAIHKYVIENSFPGTYTKSIDQLIDEIEINRQGITRSIVETFSGIRNCYENKSALFSESIELGSIKTWNKRKIELWAVIAKGNQVVPDDEILAVIKRAAEVTMKLKLRDIQILSVLLMIKCDKGKGRLSQINTGEGKTLVIAVLAAYCVFKGHKVDVYTSSPLLAIPQSEEYKEFFETLGISITNNINSGCCYDKDVIYGTNNSFQRDVLLDEFRKSGVRKGRPYEVAIVDEVDNMLIDGNNWILKLTCDMPAMDYLEVLLAVIYIQVNVAASSLVERNGETYYLQEENAIDEEGNVKPEIVVQEIPIEGSKRDFIIKSTENHMRKLIRDENNCDNIEEGYPEIKIPNHLRDVICKVQLKKWIVSAVSAIFSYTKDEDYILRDGKVTIVDADNTGVMKKNSHWCAGLHQFLEIKHGAKVQQENFTTNFISNVGLFTRYTSKLYGLTGTLGNDDTRSFLQNTYNVDTVIIPPFKQKQHKCLKAIVVDTDEAKYTDIAKSCIRKLRNGRAVLIIMKYIKETVELANVFVTQFKYKSSKIKLFKTDDDSYILEKPLQPGDLIITTNIAGRGTNIELSESVEENGGLHVCLTFLPKNSRVECQNIGRTSRKGNKGTSQFVLYDPKELDIEMLKFSRNFQEQKLTRRASETVKKIKIKDGIFLKFCELLGKIKEEHKYANESELKAVEERFALWLILNENNMDNNDYDKIYRIYDEFENAILQDCSNEELIKNPYMFVMSGNKFLNEKNYQMAIKQYTSAIILDNHFAEHAYYNRAWAYICEYGHDMDKNEHFINEAILDLKKSRTLIQDKEYCLHLLQTASKGEVFSDQLSHKLNLYGIQKNTIELAIGPDINAIDEQLEKLRKDKSNNNLPEDYKNKINEYIKNLEESKQNIGVIGRARRNRRNIILEPLGDDFMPQSDKDSHKDEITEFERNGWIGGFKITEIKPIDWASVIGLLAIGFGQLVIGAALTVFTLGAGASIGMGLISEGVSDIISAVKDGIINRDFNWATWALMKVISVAISVVCAGIKAVKDAARTVYSGSKNVLTQGISTFTQLRKQGWEIVAKKIGVDLAKGVAKEIVTDLVTYGIDKAFMPMIEELIIEKVKIPIQDALIKNPRIAQMLKLDEQNKNKNYENQIKVLAMNLLCPEKNSMIKTIALQIATRVADNKGFAITRQVCNGFLGVYEFATFTTEFMKKLNSEINQIKIVSTDCDSSENLENMNDNNQSNEDEQEIGSLKQDDDIDLKKAGQTDEQVQIKKKVRTTDKLSNEIAGLVSTNMLHILKGKIIKPITQMGVNYSVDKLSSKLNSVDKEMETYRSLKNIIHFQNRSHGTSCDDPNKMTSSEKHKVEDIIQRIKNGGPGGLIHLGAISNAVDRPIAVYDEKGRHKFTIGDSKKSTPIEIQYHAPKDGSDVGHFTLKGCREPQKEGKASNMCLFNVVAEHTGQNPGELKDLTLKMIEKNKSGMAKQVKHIRRLEIFDRRSLMEGGAQYNGKNPDQAKDFCRNSNGTIGFGNIVPGHVDKHIPFKGKTIDRLNAVADETGRQIEVYDKNGKLDYIIGQKKENVPPIKLQYHKPKGDTSAEYFSSLGGKEKYYLHDPSDMTFFDIISQQTGTSATNLRIATLSRMDEINVPVTKTCLENETKKRPKTGFTSEDEAAFVLHHALQTDVAKEKMKELNEYKSGVNDTENFKKQEVYISAKELNLPRPAYGGYWKKGKLRVSWPVTDVVLVLQHYKGQENNPDARVHIQTFFPKPP